MLLFYLEEIHSTHVFLFRRAREHHYLRPNDIRKHNQCNTEPFLHQQYLAGIFQGYLKKYLPKPGSRERQLMITMAYVGKFTVVTDTHVDKRLFP